MIQTERKSRLRAEDLYALAVDEVHHELRRGRLVSEPPAGGRHGRIAALVVAELATYACRTGAGVVLTAEAAFVLARSPDTVLVPDVAYLTLGRYQALPDESKFIPGPPDLAVEVLSPGDRVAAMRRKVADYLRAGARLVWVCDPATQTVRVHSPSGGVTLHDDDVLTAPDLMPGFQLRVGALFKPVG